VGSSRTRANLAVCDAGTLGRVGDLLHDALFSYSDVEFDDRNGVFRLQAWRELPELSRERRILPFVRRVETPRVRTELSLRQVRQAAITRTDESLDGEYCVESIRYNEKSSQVTFAIMGPLQITLDVGALVGELRDLGDPTWDAPGIATVTLSLRP